MVLSYEQMDWNLWCRTVAGWPGPVRWAWAASRAGGGAWRLEHFAARAPASVEAVRWRYKDVALAVESLSPRAAARRLRAGAVAIASAIGTRLELNPIPGNLYVDRLSSERNGARGYVGLWPELFASISFQNVRQTPSGPLAADGQRFFASWEAALGELIFERPLGPAQVHQQPSGFVRLEDRRARLADLGVSAEAVGVSVISDRSTLDGWKLLATWRSTAEDASWAANDVTLDQPGGQVVETGGVPFDFRVVLVDEGGVVVDHRGWSGGTVSVADDEQTLTARIERWRHAGEGAEVEFKQALDQARTKERFAESVAAFANTAGGVVLVGIDDRGAIVGYGAGDRDQFSHVIRDLISEPPQTEIVRIAVKGRPVWVVQVMASAPSARPHVVRGRVLVRAHGTNREATPREIRDMTTGDRSGETVWLPR